MSLHLFLYIASAVCFFLSMIPIPVSWGGWVSAGLFFWVITNIV